MLKYYSRSKAPLDGSWTDWGSWSSCYSDCRLMVELLFQIITHTAHCTLTLSHSCWRERNIWSLVCCLIRSTRNRSCTNPSPLFGGEACDGDEEDSDSCYGDTCCPGGWLWVSSVNNSSLYFRFCEYWLLWELWIRGKLPQRLFHDSLPLQWILQCKQLFSCCYRLALRVESI